MATYINLISYTDQGIRNIKDSPNRLDTARKILKDLGGEMKDFYLTLGVYDLIIVIEAPSDEVVAKFALAVGSLGNIRTTTLKAFPEAEYRNIIGALPL
ncbi:MAG: GYD domain-containing protein [Acidiferrobacterales bacterium]